MPQRLRIIVFCGGPSSEHEVSLKTAGMVLKNLNPKKYEPQLVKIEKNGKWKFGAGKALDIGRAFNEVKRLKFDFAFIAMHGAFGEDGRMQTLLEWIGLPYSGSGVLSSAMAMDKRISNILYKTSGLHVPQYFVFDSHIAAKKLNFRFPVVVKPVDAGSSVGVFIVKTKNDFRTAYNKVFKEHQRVMIQEYIKGREFTCGVLEDKNGIPFAPPPTEIIPKTSAFFDYKAKYAVGGSLEITPPELPASKIKELQELALRAHKILGCGGMSRSDFIMKGAKFYILETNTIPGMTPTSLLPQAARVAGIDFPSMLDLIIQAGLRRKN